MAVFKVQSNGKAPSGLAVNDYVITNGGAYQINTVNPDGTYKSSLVDGSINVGNYANQYGSYSTPASGGGNISEAQKQAQALTVGSAAQRNGSSSVSPIGSSTAINAGQGANVTHSGYGTLRYDASTGRITRTMPNGAQYYVDEGQEKYPSIYAEYISRYGQPGTSAPNVSIDTSNDAQIAELNAQLQQLMEQMANKQYVPVDQQQYKDNIMSYDEAYALAKKVIEPQYAETYQQAAQQAAQNLDRSGLYNSLYGQQLAAAAQNEINKDMNAAIAAQALQLQQMSRDEAMAWYNAAVGENQFGADYGLSSMQAAASVANSVIGNLLTQSQMRNDYVLQSAALELQAQAQAIDAQLAAANITQAQAETEYIKLQQKAMQLEMDMANSSYVGNGNYSSGSILTPIGGLLDAPTTPDDTTTDNDFDYSNFVTELKSAANNGASNSEIAAYIKLAKQQGWLTDQQYSNLLRGFGAVGVR